MKTITFVRSLLIICYLITLPFGCTEPFGPNSYIEIKNPNLEWNFKNYDFGQLPVGSTVKQTFEIANTGNDIAKECGPVQITDTVNFSITQDSCNQADMKPGDVCSVEISTHPTTTGEKTLQIQRECKDNYTILSPKNEIKVVAVFPNLQWDITAHDFGNLTVNTDSSIQVFTLTNSGETAATSCGLASLSNATDFAITSDTCGVLDLGVNQTCEVSVKAHPTSLGLKTATLSRTCALGGTVSTSSDQITATVTGPNLYWGTNSYDFGNITAGTNSSSSNFYLYNNGTLAASGCSVPVISNSTDFSIISNTCGTSNLAVGGSCYVQLRANPQTTGNKSTTLSRTCTVGGIASTTANQITVSGAISAGWIQEFDITDLGQIGVNRSSNDFTYFYQNKNIETITGCNPPVLSNTTDFTIVSDSCGTSNMAPLTVCSVKVKANPLIVGNYSATLSRSCQSLVSTISISSRGTTSSTVLQVISGGAGASHSCAVLSNGSVKCWGYNYYGQIGNGTAAYWQKLPVEVNSLTSVSQVAIGLYHTCAVLNDGTMKCWGSNSVGQLGDGTSVNRSTPVLVNSLTNIIQASLGTSHTCVLLNDSTVKCWGANNMYQLGDGTTNYTTTPVSVSGLTNVVQIASGAYHTCAVLNDGTLKCWGYNSDGQIGDGTLISRSTPVTVSGLSSVVQISLGEKHSCALINDGTVKCWGSNLSGRLGDGTVNNRSTPVFVNGLSNVSQIAIGMDHSCAHLTDNTVKCWGYNSTGQLGDGTKVSQNIPVSVSGLVNVNKISSGGSQSCALLNNGTVRCWGSNLVLGDGSVPRSVVPIITSGLVNINSAASGYRHNCVILNDNTVRCWGFNGSGQVGNGTTIHQNSPVIVGGIADAYQVSLGNNHSCVLLNDNTVKCWGYNGSGRLGDGTSTDRLSPVSVNSLSSVTQISLGSDHSCALINDGTVKCWGYNSSGRLGDGTTTSRSVPVAVSGLTGVIQIAAGGYHSCALINDGTVKCWGGNYDGQLGDGSLTDRYTPVSVSALSGVTKIALGIDHSCALINDGTVKCWGKNYYGQLGDGTTTRRTNPVLVSGLNGVIKINMAPTHSCAILSDSTVKCWGGNYDGQLGDGTTIDKLVPKYVLGISGSTTQVILGEGHTCSLLSDSTLKCWGSNDYGQLGVSAEVTHKVNGF